MLRLPKSFYDRDVLEVAPDLLGKTLCLLNKEKVMKYVITEVEAYRGGEDLACHASKGKTSRTEVMFENGGVIYVYLIYGMYWMLNVVTSAKDIPQAVLIRSLREVSGPGRLTRELGINKSFNGESLISSERIWIEEGEKPNEFFTSPRIGIDYSGEPWISKAWRFFI